MDKNILTFINKNYLSFGFSDLILRILGLFLYGFLVVFLVEIMSPYGYNSVTFFSNNALPYTINFTIVSILLSIVVIFLYRIKNKWSVIAIKVLTNAYISITMLICSIVGFNGHNIIFQEPLSIITKVFFYIICMVLYIYILLKKILPKFSEKYNYDNKKYIALAPSLVVMFKYILSMFDHVDAQDFLTLCYYLIAVSLLINTIDLFTKAYYAKKYKL